MPLFRKSSAALLSLLGGIGVAMGQGLDAPNVVPIDAKLVTSGQPSRAALGSLRQQGFEAVVYLAPSSVPDAIAEEPRILAEQGIEFVHIPIPFGKPEESHFLAVSEALQRLKGRKVLVHCQVNMRASSMVFLHRSLTAKQDPSKAYEAVSTVWSPHGPWRSLLQTQLKKHGIEFEPF